MNNDNFFSIMGLLTVTKYRYYTNEKVVLLFGAGKVTFRRWDADSTCMQVTIETPSNKVIAMVGSIFMATYCTSDETLNIAGIDSECKEYRYSMYIGETLLQDDISLDDLLEDDTNN